MTIGYSLLLVALTYLSFDTASACTTLDASSSTQSISFLFYSSNTDSCYIIKGGSNKRVEVYTTTLATESCFDYLELRCGDEDGEKIDTYCNGDRVNDVVSGNNKMYVRFRSDGSNTGTGFTLYYKEVSGSKASDCVNVSAALAAGIIAAIVICVLIVVAVVVVVVVCVIMQSSKRRARMRTNPTMATTVVHAPPPTQPGPGYGAQPVPPPAYGGAPQPPPPAYNPQPMGGQYPPPPPPAGADPAYPPSGVYPPPPPNPY